MVEERKKQRGREIRKRQKTRGRKMKERKKDYEYQTFLYINNKIMSYGLVKKKYNQVIFPYKAQKIKLNETMG